LEVRSRCSARAALDLEAAGQVPSVAAAALHAVLHHLPDAQQAGVDLGVAAPVAFVAAHHLGDAAAVARAAPAVRSPLWKGSGSTVVSGAMTFLRCRRRPPRR
jgi:hypothetical protein